MAIRHFFKRGGGEVKVTNGKGIAVCSYEGHNVVKNAISLTLVEIFHFLGGFKILVFECVHSLSCVVSMSQSRHTVNPNFIANSVKNTLHVFEMF